MLYSKLQCPKGFNLILFSCTIWGWFSLVVRCVADTRPLGRWAFSRSFLRPSRSASFSLWLSPSPSLSLSLALSPSLPHTRFLEENKYDLE